MNATYKARKTTSSRALPASSSPTMVLPAAKSEFDRLQAQNKHMRKQLGGALKALRVTAQVSSCIADTATSLLLREKLSDEQLVVALLSITLIKRWTVEIEEAFNAK